MRVYFGAYIWSLYKFWSLYLVPLFGAFIWSLYLEPIFGAYIWSLYLEPPALARVVPFFGICSKAPNKGTKWCLYLVPSWLGALLSGAFLKIWCGVMVRSFTFRLASRSLALFAAVGACSWFLFAVLRSPMAVIMLLLCMQNQLAVRSLVLRGRVAAAFAQAVCIASIRVPPFAMVSAMLALHLSLNALRPSSVSSSVRSCWANSCRGVRLAV